MIAAVNKTLATSDPLLEKTSLAPLHSNTVPTDSLPYVARDGMHRFDTEAILGHELRSRLAPMKHAAELLKGESVDAPTRWHIAGTIDRQLGAMTRLIEDLLYTSPRRFSELAMRCSVVPLSEVIERTLEIVRTIVSARNHTLVVELPSEPVYLHCDAMWLSQALQNLIGNAAKYTEPGGTIVLRMQSEGTDAVITVSDTGVGIAAEDLNRIFDLYAQLGYPRALNSAGGFGIGLHLVRRIVEAHGGSVQARSRGRNCGSEFCIRLP